MKPSPSVEMVVTELRRSGDGTLEDTPVVFRFSGREHSSAQNDLNLHLKVTTVRKEMPGDNSVVEHAMSATWQPFDIAGEWDDKWGNRSPAGPPGLAVQRTGPYALFMFQEFAKLVSRMSYVRLEIDALSFVGMLTDLKILYRTATKIGWTVTMSPHANETVVVERPRPRVSQSIPKWTSDCNTHGLRLNENLARLKLMPLKTPRTDFFTNALNELNDALNRLDRISGDTIAAFQNETLTDIVRRFDLLASTYRRVGASANRLKETLRTLKSLDDTAFESILDEMGHMEWRAESLSLSWLLLGVSNSAARDMEQRARQPPRSLYYPRQGESLERISMRFYGTADNWRQIYDRNRLSSLVMTGDEELIIPERS